MKSVIVIIEDYLLSIGLKIKNPLSKPKFIDDLKVLCTYIFNVKYLLKSQVIKKNYI